MEVDSMTAELPVIQPPSVNQLDAGHLLTALGRLDELYQAPVALFYLQDYSYNEIAEILEVPVGTVKSRLARGIGRLHDLLTAVQPKPPES
jgi:RNA polymerase sigma-70 factor (ECF subfamily)